MFDVAATFDQVWRLEKAACKAYPISMTHVVTPSLVEADAVAFVVQASALASAALIICTVR